MDLKRDLWPACYKQDRAIKHMNIKNASFLPLPFT